MNEKWDNLWDFNYNVDHGMVLPATWVREVKTEGDKLQEENEAITIRMDALQFCLDHCAESFDEQTKKLEAIRALNEALYEALPSGKVDAFELIKLIGSHYEQVAEVLGE